MNDEAKKTSLIEEIKKIDDPHILNDLQSVIERSKRKHVKGRSLKELAGIWTEEEAEKMKRDVEEAFGQIHPDDWK